MAVILNIDNSLDNQEQEFQIEGVTYFIHTYWNSRSGWYISIYDENNTPILQGLKALTNSNLTWRYTRRTGLFSGDLWVIDNEEGEVNGILTRDNFGQDKRFTLMYFTEQEQRELGINLREVI